jgi:diguanylate cyclase (GGDEF)-like protein
MAIARREKPFDTNEKEVLRYLIGQASVSVENIGLHERVAEQAVTDQLTGLANNRHFREWMQRETQRLGRFGGELSLVLLDIDNFKNVNDTYGHLQGDQVLSSLGRILKLESRGVDEPARYGGEEFVLALPETPKAGAIEVAERVRERIEATTVDGVEGNKPIRVTASIGVATMPADGSDPQALIAAADAALYRAKRSGKNRVEAANGR